MSDTHCRRLHRNSRLGSFIRFVLWDHKTRTKRRILKPLSGWPRWFNVHLAWLGDFSGPKPVVGMVRTQVTPDFVSLREDTHQARDCQTLCHVESTVVPNRMAASGRWPAGFEMDARIIPAMPDVGHPDLCPECLGIYMANLAAGQMAPRRAA